MDSVDAEGTVDASDPERDRLRWTDFVSSRSRAVRQELVERYLGLARIMAARLYQRRADNSVPFGDYLQYARVGLVEAIDHYDPERAVPFEALSSYRIKRAIL